MNQNRMAAKFDDYIHLLEMCMKGVSGGAAAAATYFFSDIVAGKGAVLQIQIASEARGESLNPAQVAKLYEDYVASNQGALQGIGVAWFFAMVVCLIIDFVWRGMRRRAVLGSASTTRIDTNLNSSSEQAVPHVEGTHAPRRSPVNGGESARLGPPQAHDKASKQS